MHCVPLKIKDQFHTFIKNSGPGGEARRQSQGAEPGGRARRQSQAAEPGGHDSINSRIKTIPR